MKEACHPKEGRTALKRWGPIGSGVAILITAVVQGLELHPTAPIVEGLMLIAAGLLGLYLGKESEKQKNGDG